MNGSMSVPEIAHRLDIGRVAVCLVFARIGLRC